MTGLPVSRPSVSAHLRRVVMVAAVPLILALLWAVFESLVDSVVVVGPLDSVRELWRTLGLERYQANLAVTVQTLTVSFVAAVVVGGLLGFAIGLSPFWERVFSPLVQGVYSIPKITLYPLFLVFLGLGVQSRTAFGFVHGVLPMMIVVMGAAAQIRRDSIYLKLAASMVMTWGQLLRHILVPAVLPTVMTAVRMTFGLTFLGVLLAEMFATNGGLGHELVMNIQRVRIDRILAQVLFIAVIALIPNAGLRALENHTRRRYTADDAA